MRKLGGYVVRKKYKTYIFSVCGMTRQVTMTGGEMDDG